jgi:hypothetical protein
VSAARDARADVEVGCVVAREVGVLVVLTDAGPVRASYGARMLGAIARDRSRLPEVGEWVSLRHWCDGPVTVEGTLARPARRPLATVLPLRSRRGDRRPGEWGAGRD